MLTAALILALLIPTENCEKFGYKDSLTCHCGGGTCDKETGICSSGKCQQGWSGPSCQRQNVALNNPATQSSYYTRSYPDISEDMMSGYAVDGDTSHKSTLGLNPGQSKCVDMNERDIGWWSVDLQQNYHLNTIQIYHREGGWLKRFTRASVNIIDEDGQSSKCYQNEKQPTSPVFPINCVGTGRYLNFTQSTGEGILNLCEIEVYVCSVGTFGSECTKFCHCKKNTRCDDVTGSCPDGCLPGWEGESCNRSCSDTRYSNACRSRCVDRNCFGNSPCDHVTGNCTRGCKQGFMGADCMLSCSDTYRYGDACRSRCVDRNCFGNSSCDHVTGNCTDGCKQGFMGADCMQSCSDTNTYGDACKSRCADRNCFGNSSCDHVTGYCTGGCKQGFMGVDCMLNCDQGFYGDGCKLNCTERKCLNMTSSCDHVTGTCDEGCQEGYNGDDCTKSVENPGTSPLPIILIASAGGGGGAVLLLIIIIIIVIVIRLKRSKKRESSDQLTAVDEYDTAEEHSNNVHGKTNSSFVPDDSMEAITSSSKLAVVQPTLNTYSGNEKGEIISENLIYVSSDDISGVSGADSTVNQGTSASSLPLVSKTDPISPVHTEWQKSGENMYENLQRKSDIIEQSGVTVKSLDQSGVSVKSLDQSGVIVKNLEEIPKTQPILPPLSNNDMVISDEGNDNDDDLRSVDSEAFDTPNEAGEDNSKPEHLEKEYHDYYNIRLDKTKLTLEELPTFYASTKETCGFPKIFSYLPFVLSSSVSVSRKPENFSKCRFRGYYPYDHSRVVLETLPGDPHSDFINASYIDGYKEDRVYIAAQGPTENTINDFVRMIWEKKCDKVLMLTKLFESAKMKCERYWPLKGSETFGDFVLTLNNEKIKACYTIRQITMKRDETHHKFYHFHYTSWPDHDVPDVSDLLDFLYTVNKVTPQSENPQLIHCSAGVGRTGTYIAIDKGLKQGEQTGSVDVIQIVEEMRNQRKGMVQTPSQLQFVFESLIEGFKFGNTCKSKAEFETEYKSKSTDIMMGNMSLASQCRELLEMDESNKASYINVDISSTNISLPSRTNGRGYVVGELKYHDTESLWMTILQQQCSTVVCLINAQNSLTICSDVVGSKDTSGEVSFETQSVRKVSDNLNIITVSASGVYDEDCRKVQVLLVEIKDAQTVKSAIDQMKDYLDEVELDHTHNPIGVFSSIKNCGLIFCLLRNIVQRIKLDEEVEVFYNVKNLHQQNSPIVRSQEDYLEILEFVADYIRSQGIYENL